MPARDGHRCHLVGVERVAQLALRASLDTYLEALWSPPRAAAARQVHTEANEHPPPSPARPASPGTLTHSPAEGLARWQRLDGARVLASRADGHKRMATGNLHRCICSCDGPAGSQLPSSAHACTARTTGRIVPAKSQCHARCSLQACISRAQSCIPPQPYTRPSDPSNASGLQCRCRKRGSRLPTVP